MNDGSEQLGRCKTGTDVHCRPGSCGAWTSHATGGRTSSMVFGRPLVKRFALCYKTVVCLFVCPVMSVLSVTLVYCGQTVGWIKIKLGMEICLGPGHNVLDGDPALPPPKGHSPRPLSARLLWPNGRPSQLLLSSCCVSCFVMPLNCIVCGLAIVI